MALKKKKRPPARKKPSSRSRPVPQALGEFGLSWITPTRWTWVLLAASLALYLLCHLSYYRQAEYVFLILSVMIGLSGFLKLSNLRHILPLVLLGWVSFTLALGTHPNFQFAFSIFPPFELPNVLTQLALGIGLLVAFWRFLPPAEKGEDISPWMTRFWLAVILVVAVYFRCYKINEPAGIYWDDCAVSIVDARSILEFHERPFLMPIANREPFYCYFLAALWAPMPHAYAIFVHRLGGALIDLLAVGLFYFVGKEAGGRLVGLVAAALGAVSKPMIIATVTGNAHVTGPMAVALVLLATLRLFRDPSWKNFILWGLALGFAPYNYTSVRPWLLFIVTAVFLWTWFYRQPQGKTNRDLWLGWGTLAAWAFCFLLVNNFLPKQNPLIELLSHPWVGIGLVLALGYLFFQDLKIPRSPGATGYIPRFFAGVLLAALVVYPLAIQPLIAVHASGLSIFHTHDSSLAVNFGLDTFKLFFQKIAESFHILFMGGEDRGDMNLADDAFFDFHFIPVLAFGALSVLTRPNWTSLFFLIAGLVGISPHILSVDPHSGKLICCLAPLAILAGLGVKQLYQAYRKAFPGEAAKALAACFAAAYFTWSVWGSNEKVLNTFFRGGRVEKTVSLQVKKYAVDDRVYLAPYSLFVSFVVQAILNQGYDVYALQDSNPVFLSGDEKPMDVVVIMHLYDRATTEKVQKAYKNITWEVINLDGWRDARPTFKRAIIPASEIGDKPGRLFYYKRTPATDWTRDYLAGRYILGYGVIDYPERTADPFAPIAPGMGGRLVNLRGSFNLSSENQVEFKVRTNDFVDLKIDGRSVIYIKPDWGIQAASHKMTLAAGPHQVEYDIWLQHIQAIPEVTVSIGGAPDVLLSSLSIPPATSRP